jgi:glycosyltransferase involved in cell wall biosynthesis
MNKFMVRNGRLVKRSGENPAGARVAFVGVYGVPCGIATYTEALIRHMRPQVADIHVFAEREANLPDSNDITRCWNRGQPLHELVEKVKAYDPDIVFVQHEYGNFPNARHWLSFISALQDWHVVTVLHSVYAHRDKTIVEAACRDIIVHTPAALHMLKDVKQVGGRITHIPHGCSLMESNDRLWNLYGSEHTLVQFGFGFNYKGWDHALETVAALKPEFPDIFYTGLMSERWPGVHDNYRRDLLELAVKLGIKENVALIPGFQSDETLDSYLRTNRVAFFPYRDNHEHAVFGCSGAARLAMSKGIPVVASGVPLFDDLSGVVARPTTVEGWAAAIRETFGNKEEQVRRQAAFLIENSWDNTVKRYLSLL